MCLNILFLIRILAAVLLLLLECCNLEGPENKTQKSSLDYRCMNNA